MKLIFQTETELLQEINFSDLDENMTNQLKKSFDKRTVKKYEITFVEGVSVSQIHDISKIDEEMIKTLKVTIE